MRYFITEPAALEKEPILIKGTDARHICTVLRLQPGDTIGLLDGTGNGFRARILTVDPSRVAVRILAAMPPAPSPPVRLVIAQAYLKDKKMDQLVRRLTELGMAEWRPFVSARSVARPSEQRLAARQDRWRSIARDAIKQCHRADLPLIHPCRSFSDMISGSDDCCRRIIFWEQASAALDWCEALVKDGTNNGLMVVLGPEGGFTRGEVIEAQEHGFIAAGLGPRVLGADTAAVSAATIVQYDFGDLGPKTY